MTDENAQAILKKHAAANGDSQYEPAAWLVDAMKEAAELASKAADKAWLAQVAYEDSANVVARRMGYSCRGQSNSHWPSKQQYAHRRNSKSSMLS